MKAVICTKFFAIQLSTMARNVFTAAAGCQATVVHPAPSVVAALLPELHWQCFFASASLNKATLQQHLLPITVTWQCLVTKDNS